MTTPSPTRFTRFQQRYRTVERGTTVVADRQTDGLVHPAPARIGRVIHVIRGGIDHGAA